MINQGIEEWTKDLMWTGNTGPAGEGRLESGLFLVECNKKRDIFAVNIVNSRDGTPWWNRKRLIDQRILSQESFSKITDIHDQVDLQSDPTVVATIRELFKKHNLNDRFEIHLLHRHFELPPDTLFDKSPEYKDISLMQMISVDEIDIAT